jgi:hypothetical protein
MAVFRRKGGVASGMTGLPSAGRRMGFVSGAIARAA